MVIKGEDGKEYDYDLVTIGAGSGGVRASRVSSSKYNAKVAVVEMPFGFVPDESTGGAGGTCVIRGCVPKKLLLYASSFSSDFKASEGFGWSPISATVDMKKLIARKNEEIRRLNGVYSSILKSAGVEHLEGRGVVLDPHTVEVRGTDGSVRQLSTRHILIATGGHAEKLGIPGAEHAITSDEGLVLDDFGERPIVVVGGGYIAVELAGIFHGLGAPTHIMFRAEAPLRGFDEECRHAVLENLGLSGMTVHASCRPQKIERLGPRHLRLHYLDSQDREQSVECGTVLMATGRKPNTRGLGLEDAGVKLHDKTRAVLVDEHSQSSVPSIWAIGDATDRMNLTPVALMEGRALASTLFGGVPASPDYGNVPTAVFCQPTLGTVGLTEAEAVARLSGTLQIYVSRFRPMRNTLSGAPEKTLMKLIVHGPTQRVLGCHMVGPDAAEIVQGLGIALKCRATKADFDATVGVHPSAAEEWVTMSSLTREVQGKGEISDVDKLYV